MNSKVKNKLKLRGYFTVKHMRDGKVLREFKVSNGVCDQGINDLLDIAFYTKAKIDTWYLGLITASGYTGIAAADTMDSHSGWSEFTGYSESTRPAWEPAAPASKSIVSGAVTTFSFTSGGTLKGFFVTSNNVKSGVTGSLWATSILASDLSVNNGDEISFTYTVTAS